MKLEILPSKGLGKLNFGMTKAEVRTILGQEKDRSLIEDMEELYFDNYLNLAFRDNLLFQIGAVRHSEGITYKNIDIFESDPISVLRKMETDAGGAFEMYGFIVYPGLGISLTGFHDEDYEQKAVTVAVLEEWESVRTELRPISFL